MDGPLACVRGEAPEDLDYEGAAEHLQTVWIAVRASLRSVVDELTLADVVAGRMPAACTAPHRGAGRLVAPLVRIGVQLPEVEREVRWPEYLAMAQAAEEVGFDSIWLGDHLLYRGEDGPDRGPWDAWTLLAALAARTQRVQLGPLVACTAFHPPGLIARMAAALAR